MEAMGVKIGSWFPVRASTLAEFTKGKLPFIQRVAYSTFRIDAYDREVACVSSKEPQGEGSLKFYCGFSIVLKLFLQW